MQSVPSKMREEHRPPLLKCLQDSVALHSGHALLLCGVAYGAPPLVTGPADNAPLTTPYRAP